MTAKTTAGSFSEDGFGKIVRRFARRGRDERILTPDESKERYRPEVVPPNLDRIHSPDPEVVQITWIGHATFLIQADGVNFLTDPIYSRCCAPVYLPTLRRRAPPGIPFQQLPEIHSVLISHDHYDHMDRRTIRRLGDNPRYFLPMGVSAWFRKNRFRHFEELDWGAVSRYAGCTIHCVPAQHCSGRGVFDRNRALWCGWVVEAAGKKIYFTGDSGYSPLFTEIGEEHGPVDCAIIPIGAYSPRWFMHPVHVDPTEAVKIHLDVRARRSLASHWGTFKLTDEPLAEPPVFLKKAARARGLAPDEFRTLRFGETVVL